MKPYTREELNEAIIRLDLKRRSLIAKNGCKREIAQVEKTLEDYKSIDIRQLRIE